MSEYENQTPVKAERSKNSNVHYNKRQMTIAAVVIIAVLIILITACYRIANPRHSRPEARSTALM